MTDDLRAFACAPDPDPPRIPLARLTPSDLLGRIVRLHVSATSIGWKISGYMGGGAQVRLRSLTHRQEHIMEWEDLRWHLVHRDLFLEPLAPAMQGGKR